MWAHPRPLPDPGAILCWPALSWSPPRATARLGTELMFIKHALVLSARHWELLYMWYCIQSFLQPDELGITGMMRKFWLRKVNLPRSGCLLSLLFPWSHTASLTHASSAPRMPCVPPTRSNCQPGRAPFYISVPPSPHPTPCLMLISHLSTEYFINSKAKMNFLPAIISSLDIH